MADIEEYEKGYTLRVTGGDHYRAMVYVYPDKETQEPKISTQKADALVRECNPNLRLTGKGRFLNWWDGTTQSWVRYYADNREV